MKPPVLLKSILDIAFYLLIGIAVLGFVLAIMTLVNPDSDFLSTTTINGSDIENLSSSAIYISLLLGFGYLTIFIVAIYYLRALVNNFLIGKIFTEIQVKYLNHIGILIIIISAASIIFPIVKSLSEEELAINMTLSADFGSFWFTLALGLFFIFLSQVFEKARLLKEDNDLTV